MELCFSSNDFYCNELLSTDDVRATRRIALQQEIRYKGVCNAPTNAMQNNPMPKFNPDIHHRRSLRLKNYDYSRAGAYFVTVCVQNRECLFGEIGKGEIRLNECGRIVENEWLKTTDIRNNVELDYYIVMPNHFHGILIINDVGATHRVAPFGQTAKNRAIHRIAPTTLKPNSLGAIIGQFKSIVTKQINTIRNAPHTPVWQRNYYEHIIRNEKSLDKIREYIMNNPLNWATDIEHPVNRGSRTAEEYYKDIVEKI